MRVSAFTGTCLILSLVAIGFLLLNSPGSSGGTVEADYRAIPPDRPQTSQQVAPVPDKADATAANTRAAIALAQSGLTSALGVASTANASKQDQINDHLEEAAREIANANRKLASGNLDGALDKAQEALDEIAAANQLRAAIR